VVPVVKIANLHPSLHIDFDQRYLDWRYTQISRVLRVLIV